jgi:WD40 repeat protein
MTMEFIDLQVQSNWFECIEAWAYVGVYVDGSLSATYEGKLIRSSLETIDWKTKESEAGIRLEMDESNERYICIGVTFDGIEGENIHRRFWKPSLESSLGKKKMITKMAKKEDVNVEVKEEWEKGKRFFVMDASEVLDEIVLGGEDGVLCVWDVSLRKFVRSLPGHVADVAFVRYFPSGTIVFSGGADLSAQVTRTLDGFIGASLIGHQARVQDGCFIGRGRNLFTAGKDGMGILWECSTKKSVASFRCGGDPVSCCVCLDGISNGVWTKEDLGLVVGDPSLHFETEGALVCLGTDHGNIESYRMHDGCCIMSIEVGSFVLGMCHLGGRQVACVTGSGEIMIIDCKDGIQRRRYLTASPISCIEPSTHDLVQCLGFSHVWVGVRDGSAICVDVDTLEIKIVLSGTEFFVVHSIICRHSSVWVLSDDQVLRRYDF